MHLIIFLSAFLASSFAAAPVLGAIISSPRDEPQTAALWSLCGGIAWTGPIVCTPPGICVVLNQFWSQCQLPRVVEPTTSIAV
ncbi:hypothetical protein BDQ12DRAFT_688598 [Crucibulum laeve]|uniref:CBM1 domain-containing protein n=1 Tax=Crucibulum laeve TaxID=68775 RepID=A0A5C3LS24_9AGAR|nr:hypothetical protein BDQ12DRAFT_688598 [Crucibulum laeve]